MTVNSAFCQKHGRFYEGLSVGVYQRHLTVFTFHTIRITVKSPDNIHATQCRAIKSTDPLLNSEICAVMSCKKNPSESKDV